MLPALPAGATHRRRSLAVVVAALLATVLLSACLTTGQQHAASHLNADRRAHGRRVLGTQSDAQAKAQAWANHLASINRLEHSNLASGIRARWCNLGENVGYGADTQRIEGQFMASSAHRANILSTTWNGQGVGVARNGSRVYVVQVFIRTC